MIEINVPGSKSITQRALICASLANGDSVIENPLICEDSEYLINGLQGLGVDIDISDNIIKISGKGGVFQNNGKRKIFMGNNGTGYRFLLTIANFYKNEVVLTGNEKLQKRPVKDLVDTLKSLGFNLIYTKDEGFPPVKVTPVNKIFKEKVIAEINGSKSSQFISSLLLSSVLFKNEVEVITTGKIVSTPYIEITLKVMKDFGVEVINEKNKYLIKKDSKYNSLNYNIEGDFSSASYFIAASFFLNKEIKLKNINYNSSLQGDKGFIDILKKMGAKFNIKENEIIVYPTKLHGIEVDMNKMPDIVLTLAVLSVLAQGETLIKNIKHLRYKETDRVEALCKNLKKIGVKISYGEDYIKIIPDSDFKKYNNVIIDPEDDHRIAMSFALFNLIGFKNKILDRDCVKKSFPNFWKLFETLF